jgi:hypothetical protein
MAFLTFIAVEEFNNDISGTTNFKVLSLHGEELAAMKFAEDNPSVIICCQHRLCRIEPWQILIWCIFWAPHTRED